MHINSLQMSCFYEKCNSHQTKQVMVNIIKRTYRNKLDEIAQAIFPTFLQEQSSHQ